MASILKRFTEIPSNFDKWYVLYSGKSSVVNFFYFKLVAEGINVEFWVPVYTQLRKKGTDLVKVLKPLVSGYIFARFPDFDPDPEITATKLIQIEGVLRKEWYAQFLSYTPVEANQFKQFCFSVKEFSSVPRALQYNFKPGDIVRVTTGPFSGLPAKVFRLKDDNVHLKIRMLGREVDLITKVVNIDSI